MASMSTPLNNNETGDIVAPDEGFDNWGKVTQNMLIHDLVVHHVARMPADPMLDTDHDVDMDAPPLM